MNSVSVLWGDWWSIIVGMIVAWAADWAYGSIMGDWMVVDLVGVVSSVESNAGAASAVDSVDGSVVVCADAVDPVGWYM